jgi:hypothetical protein
MASPLFGPAGALTGTVNAPGNTSLGIGSTAAASFSREGGLLDTSTRGQYGASTANRSVFFASSPLAGSVVPLSATNQVVKFMLWNPAGSGKDVELISFSWQQFGSGTEIVTQLGLAFQPNVSVTGVPGTQTTQGTGGPFNARIAPGATPGSVCSFWIAATLANPAIGVSYQHMWLMNTTLATTVTDQSKIINFNGSVIMPPDTLVTPVAALTGTEIEACMTLVWAEYPV